MQRASLSSRSVQYVFLVFVAAAWYFLTESGNISRLFLPKPGDVIDALTRLFQTASFWSAVLVTLTTALKGFVIALVLGVLAGYLVTRSKLAIATIEPLISGLFTIPITLFFPMFILFFGVGTGSKVAYGATYAFFPIALNTIAAFSNMEKRYLLAAQSMGGSRWDIFRYVLMPGALPVLFTGLRIGFFICLASVLGGETISSVAGIGRNIALAAELMEPARMFAWILFVVCMSVTLNLLAYSFENKIRSR
ncbi:ABC transporter permease [Roseiarcaceae bacterium H3SJ34-1]|uniref:ABC transporter permease n=1 Tax=Terripilifer ovatus TaxID=3032367 RepID=UPI003AB99468|nr:ABC transporter permease [Roseiarcaceae bacterium H3SJ34-1]